MALAWAPMAAGGQELPAQAHLPEVDRAGASRPSALCLAAARGDGDAVALVLGEAIIHGYGGLTRDDPGIAAAREDLAAGRVGGVLLLGRNVASVAQVKALTADLQAAARRPPALLAIDQEGGQIQRLGPRAGFPPYPSARAAGRLRDAHDELALVWGEMARRLAEVGVTVNLAPVVDLDFGQASPAIGRYGRAFARDPEFVARLARTFVEAHRAHGVGTVLKHFPGHGSAQRDSHDVLPDVSAAWTEEERMPFARLIASGDAEMVMLAHLRHPAYSDGAAPVSLSASAVKTLRDEMGFAGPIMADALDMRAVSATYSVEEAAVLAFVAGVDLLLVADVPTPDPGAARRLHAALLEAWRGGEITTDRVAEACDRGAGLRGQL